MWYADTVGLKTIYARVREYERQFGELWAPAPLLARLAETGSTFAAWDAERENARS
jgi:3-hydroxyacyl-CoA dehydrogenase